MQNEVRELRSYVQNQLFGLLVGFNNKLNEIEKAINNVSKNKELEEPEDFKFTCEKCKDTGWSTKGPCECTKGGDSAQINALTQEINNDV